MILILQTPQEFIPGSQSYQTQSSHALVQINIQSRSECTANQSKEVALVPRVLAPTADRQQAKPDRGSMLTELSIMFWPLRDSPAQLPPLFISYLKIPLFSPPRGPNT